MDLACRRLVRTLVGVSRPAVKMTSMPEMVGLFNGFGGLASMLVGWAEYHGSGPPPKRTAVHGVAIFSTVLIGGVTFSGSMVAYAKLAEKMTGKPILFKGQHSLTVLLLARCGVGVVFCCWLTSSRARLVHTASSASRRFGLVAGAGRAFHHSNRRGRHAGGDLPAEQLFRAGGMRGGFVILNNVLIVAGSLVGRPALF